MDGGSIAKELLSTGLDVSASAFVQRRKRFEWQHFERILEEFNEMCEDTATFKGYRVFAVDGTSVNLARDPKADTFMVNDSAPKGYNQVHVTPLYDVLNKTYHDCCLQPQPKQDEIGVCRVCYCSIIPFRARPSSSVTADSSRIICLRTCERLRGWSS